MKIIITGAAGLVGQNLVPLLVKEGYRVVAIDKSENIDLLSRLNPTIKCIKTDVSEVGSWQEDISNADCVIELHSQIASKYSERFDKSNVVGVNNVLQACSKYNIKHLIHLSSSVVMSSAKDDYTRTKKIGEELVQNSGVPFTILRPSLIYGPFDPKHLGWITRLMEKTPVIPVLGSGKYSKQSIYILDLCKVLIELIKRGPENKVWNITGKEKIYFIELLKKIAKVRGWKRLFIRIPIPLFSLMLKLYSLITDKPMFTLDQMKALLAGDDSPVDNWTEEFGVEYTPFDKGMWETWHCENSKYSKEMKSPH